MIGECHGLQVSAETAFVDSIEAYYTPRGITAVTFKMDLGQTTLGNKDISAPNWSSRYPFVESWNFDAADGNTFIGLEVWQSGTVIHGMNTIALDTVCTKAVLQR